MHVKLSCGMKSPSCGRGRCYGLADKRSGSSSFMRVPSTRLPLVLMAVIGCSLLSSVTARSLNVNVHSRALKQQQLQGPIAATATEAAPTSGSRSSNATAASPHPEAPRAADLKVAAQTDPAAATAAAASTPDPNAPWNQRRTLQLPPHVYLISFIMLLVIMAALLSCHCYRMCRIARRMRQAAELGVTVSGAGSALCKRTPQAIIEALPVTKYASISSLRAGSSFSMKGPMPATAAACNAGGGDGAAAAAAAAAAASSTASTAAAPAAPRRLPLLEAAMQLKEQIIRQTGISASRTSRTTTASSSSSHLGAAGPSSSAMAAGTASTAITNECGASSAAGGGSSSRQQLPLQVEIVAVTAEPPATGNQDGDHQDGNQMPVVGGSSSGDYAAAPAVAAAAALPVSTAAAAAALLNRQKQSPAGHNSSSSSSGGEPCAICFEDFAPDDDVKQLPCAHFYHCGCIDEWLVRDVTCPLCKAPVLDKDLLEQQQRAAAALEANFAHLGMAVRRRQQQQRDRDRQQQRQQQRQQRRHERRQQRRDRWLRRSTPPLGLGRRLPGGESFVLPAGTAAADPPGAVGGSSSSASGTGTEQAASAEAAASGSFTQQQQQQQQQVDGRLQRLRHNSSSSSSSSPSPVRELLELAAHAMMRFPAARHPHSAAPRQQQQQQPAAAAAAAAGAGSSATDVEMGEARR